MPELVEMELVRSMGLDEDVENPIGVVAVVAFDEGIRRVPWLWYPKEFPVVDDQVPAEKESMVVVLQGVQCSDELWRDVLGLL